MRYAYDFKIICKNYQDAVKLKIATMSWLKEKLSLEVSEEKTKIVNLKRNYSEFLGFKIKVRRKKKNGGYIIISHISDKASERVRVKDSIKSNLKSIRKANSDEQIVNSISKYNENINGFITITTK